MSGGLTGVTNGCIMILESANSNSQGLFFKKALPTVYFSGCNKSPLVDLTHKSPVRVGAPAGLRGRSASGLFLFLVKGAPK